MQFIKDFKSKINQSAQLIILIVILAIVFYSKFNFGTVTVQAVVNLVVLLLMLGSIAYLLMDNKLFSAHIAVLILYFSSAAQAFLNSLFSLQFSPFGFLNPLTGLEIINFIIFGYLALMVTSYVLNGGLKTRAIKSYIGLLIIAFVGYLWLFNGFNNAVYYFLVLGAIYLFGSDKSVLIMLVAMLISMLYFSIYSMTIYFILTDLITAFIEMFLLLITVKFSIDIFKNV